MIFIMNFNNLVGSVVISRISMIFVFVFVEGHYVNYRATGLPINKIFVCLFVSSFRKWRISSLTPSTSFPWPFPLLENEGCDTIVFNLCLNNNSCQN